jgi:Zn-dependent peptidase ImmA (M78 family)
METSALTKKRQRQIKQYLKRLGLDSKTDLEFILTEDIQSAETRSIIRLNPNVSDKEFRHNVAHELLHYLGLNHNEDTRRIHYSSTSTEKDLLSKALAHMLE